MAKYNKLWVAIIGVVLIAGKELLGIDLGVDADGVWNVIVPILTALGVYAVPNKDNA